MKPAREPLRRNAAQRESAELKFLKPKLSIIVGFNIVLKAKASGQGAGVFRNDEELIMKQIKVVLALAVLLVSVSSSTAWADRHHGGVGVIIDVPLFWPGYYPLPYHYPYYPPYYPPTMVVPSSPPVYIEQEPQSAPPQQSQPYYWHYCSKPQGYYPYVKECPGGWQQVSPQPPSQP